MEISIFENHNIFKTLAVAILILALAFSIFYVAYVLIKMCMEKEETDILDEYGDKYSEVSSVSTV
jgi:protein-S-isoprenylcysteine O-methyltransferase Ste14